MTILYVPKKCEGSSLQVRKKRNETNNGENKKDENEMIVKYNRMR